MSVEPTVESHPWQVGRVVYETRAEAESRALIASCAYPTARVSVIDRRSMTAQVEYLGGSRVEAS